MRLKILIGYVGAAMLGAMFAMPAFAQSPHAEAELQHWMARDPRLEADPGLMDNPTYLRNHPNFAIWLQQHPGVHRQVEMLGAYDANHHWRNTEWWRQNNPNWIYQNHPEWIEHHPEWRSYGDWDEHHEWHDRGWWAANHPDWAAQHHPEWAAHREAAIEHHEAAIEHHEAAVERHEEHVEHREAAIEHHEAAVEHHQEHLEHYDHH
jgi:hypothetical protein